MLNEVFLNSVEKRLPSRISHEVEEPQNLKIACMAVDSSGSLLAYMTKTSVIRLVQMSTMKRAVSLEGGKWWGGEGFAPGASERVSLAFADNDQKLVMQTPKVARLFDLMSDLPCVLADIFFRHDLVAFHPVNFFLEKTEGGEQDVLHVLCLESPAAGGREQRVPVLAPYRIPITRPGEDPPIFREPCATPTPLLTDPVTEFDMAPPLTRLEEVFALPFLPPPQWTGRGSEDTPRWYAVGLRTTTAPDPSETEGEVKKKRGPRQPQTFHLGIVAEKEAGEGEGEENPELASRQVIAHTSMAGIGGVVRGVSASVVRTGHERALASRMGGGAAQRRVGLVLVTQAERFVVYALFAEKNEEGEADPTPNREPFGCLEFDFHPILSVVGPVTRLDFACSFLWERIGAQPRFFSDFGEHPKLFKVRTARDLWVMVCYGEADRGRPYRRLIDLERPLRWLLDQLAWKRARRLGSSVKGRGGEGKSAPAESIKEGGSQGGEGDEEDKEKRTSDDAAAGAKADGGEGEDSPRSAEEQMEEHRGKEEKEKQERGEEDAENEDEDEEEEVAEEEEVEEEGLPESPWMQTTAAVEWLDISRLGSIAEAFPVPRSFSVLTLTHLGSLHVWRERLPLCNWEATVPNVVKLQKNCFRIETESEFDVKDENEFMVEGERRRKALRPELTTAFDVDKAFGRLLLRYPVLALPRALTLDSSDPLELVPVSSEHDLPPPSSSMATRQTTAEIERNRNELISTQEAMRRRSMGLYDLWKADGGVCLKCSSQSSASVQSAAASGNGPTPCACVQWIFRGSRSGPPPAPSPGPPAGMSKLSRIFSSAAASKTTPAKEARASCPKGRGVGEASASAVQIELVEEGKDEPMYQA
uniref:Uncharacterized protein n=1 Tax=Chromera velia CCMP2878 TaxID=1169474 RepID=A0A0G4HEY9_9ALVE|eukprot:Cvel_26744.t1-p1 / transcript=Cvel_26744.t1 / gene=Cvel_26744 / organism=Chromera_velia_CCMP2878 / gene_product=hypothetical protein / transcript_product=hypothetical protein / location=Cvel_scaffold3229:3386-7933(-) / protein_length=871 / sequence_SO=supercontig / SO=protein_coding / is_pseudo=false